MAERHGVPDSDATTRERVATSMLTHGPSTAAQLGERLNLTSAAIRRHLAMMLDKRTITSREQRVYGQRGRGRPAKVFLLTDQGRSDFYQAYDELAIQALNHLVRSAGQAAVSALAEQRIAVVEASYRSLREQQPELAPADALAVALSDDGYVASITPVASGLQLCQHHCPIAHVAEEFPELCEVETQVFSRLLGTHVQRLATIAHGDGVCTTHIPSTRQGGTTPLEPPAGPGDASPPSAAVVRDEEGGTTPLEPPAGPGDASPRESPTGLTTHIEISEEGD